MSKHANETINEIQRIKAEQYDLFCTWISVKDRLPAIMESVLFTDGRYRDIGHRNPDNELYCCAALLLKSLPTHWMPLPELPEC